MLTFRFEWPVNTVKIRKTLRFAGELTTVVVSNDGIRWYARNSCPE